FAREGTYAYANTESRLAIHTEPLPLGSVTYLTIAVRPRSCRFAVSARISHWRGYSIPIAWDYFVVVPYANVLSRPFVDTLSKRAQLRRKFRCSLAATNRRRSWDALPLATARSMY